MKGHIKAETLKAVPIKFVPVKVSLIKVVPVRVSLIEEKPIRKDLIKTNPHAAEMLREKLGKRPILTLAKATKKATTGTKKLKSGVEDKKK